MFKIISFGGLCLNQILSAFGHCVDIHSQIISQGLHYVPGPNSCTLCICDKGGPKWCKSVLCSQPQNCKSFQRGNSCCEFKCLDDILTASDTYKDTYDLALRLIACAVFIILTVSLFFFIIHRFRRHKLRVQQNRQLNEDQRSLNSIGYITGSLGYLPGNIGYLGSGNNDLELHYEESNGHYSLWKPPENYFPRGEAPPPYEEAIRFSQIDTNIIPIQSVITNTSNNVITQSNEIRSVQHAPNTIQCRHQHLTNRANINQEYANITIETVSDQHANPLIKIENGVKTITNSAHHDFQSNSDAMPQVKEYKTCVSEKSKSSENIVGIRKNEKTAVISEQKNVKNKSHVFIDHEQSVFDKNTSKFHRYENITLKNSLVPKDIVSIRKTHKPQIENGNSSKEVCYENTNPCYENIKHRTIPLLPEYQTKSISLTKESKSKHNIHIPTENNVKKDLNKADTSEKFDNSTKNVAITRKNRDASLHRTIPTNLKELTISVSSNSEYIPSSIFKRFEHDDLLHRSLSKPLTNCDTVLSVNLLKSQVNLMENLSSDISPSKEVKNESTSVSTNVGFVESKMENELIGREDEHSFISYQCLSSQDEDDYRSECENCKSVEMMDLQDEEGDVFNETMTLQRRPETSEEVPYYRTSLTLPSQIRKPRFPS